MATSKPANYKCKWTGAEASELILLGSKPHGFSLAAEKLKRTHCACQSEFERICREPQLYQLTPDAQAELHTYLTARASMVAARRMNSNTPAGAKIRAAESKRFRIGLAIMNGDDIEMLAEASIPELWGGLKRFVDELQKKVVGR